MLDTTNLIVEKTGMGGNVKIGEQGAEPITMNMRKERRVDVDKMLHSINKHSGHKIFGYGAPSLASGAAYSGSTAHMMDKTLKDDELRKFKKSFGDIDVMVPHDTEEHLTKALEPGTKHGKFTVVGTKKLGGQVSAIMKHADGKHHQVDFEYKNFDKETQEPDDFAKFSQNSDISDMKSGLKGAAHKALILALTSRSGQRGVVEKIKGGKSTYSPTTSIKSHTFSQMKGTRVKHIPSLDKDGKQKEHNGQKVYNELGSENASYNTDLSKVHETLFGVPGKEGDIKAMHSFAGVTKSMKKHLKPEEIRNVVYAFAKSLYNKRSATHMHANPTQDNAMKVHALRELRKQFPEHFDKLMYDKISEKRENYYDKPAKNIKEDIETSTKIAFAGGRFTGPTREHEKLLDQLFAEQADEHRVYVFGPKLNSEVTARDPQTARQKVDILRELYPDHADSFIAGDTPHTANMTQALVHTWHDHMNESVDLVVFAGDGKQGIKGAAAGGSATIMEDMLDRLNGSVYSINEAASTGGNYRMNFASYQVVRNPRGDTSGTVLREAAANGQNVRDLMHSRTSMFRACQFVKTMQALTPNNLEDVIGENYEIIEKAAADLNLPVEMIEEVCKHALSTNSQHTAQFLSETVHSIATRLVIREDENLLKNTTDTFVIMYHPDNLYYQIERVAVAPDQPVKQQPVIAERLHQGFIITSVHANSATDEATAHTAHLRKYRRQIDD
jgi:hypothetical protein